MIRILAESESLQTEFERCMRDYEQYWFCSPYVSAFFKFANLLLEKYLQRLECFYITYWDCEKNSAHKKFISRLKSAKANYRCLNSSLHSKVYLFVNSEKDWVCFLGSSNYTKAGFLGANDETVVMFDQDNDFGGENCYVLLKNFFLDLGRKTYTRFER